MNVMPSRVVPSLPGSLTAASMLYDLADFDALRNRGDLRDAAGRLDTLGGVVGAHLHAHSLSILVTEGRSTRLYRSAPKQGGR